jgi:hypothetical protein
MNDQISLEPNPLDAMDPHHDDALLTTTTITSNNTCSTTSTPPRSRDDDSRHDAVNESVEISEPQLEPCSSTAVGTSTNHSILPLHDPEPQSQPQPQQEPAQIQQEAEQESANLLATILDELEMERARRIQAELNLSEYQQQQQKQHGQKQKESRRDEEHGLYNAHASLIVAHEIHATFFAESLTVSKKQFSLWKLSTFFSKYL